MKVLCIADHVDPFIYSSGIRSRFKDVDLVLSAGDLSLEYYDFIVSSLNKPLFFVFGNHHLDSRNRYDHRSDPLKTPAMPDWQGGVGATYLEGRVVRSGGLIIAGLGGSIWYNGGENQFTDLMMFFSMLRLLPGMLWNRVFRGRWIDILVTHSPPYGINDLPDPCHTGFRVFLWFMRTFRPRYLVHGHVHLYDRNAAREARYGSTTILNAYDHAVIEVEADPVSDGRNALYLVARGDFGRARQREIMGRILGFLKSQKDEMLSLPDVRRIVRPESETYRGLQTVPIARIVGSEGRSHDFNRAFLPRHDKMMRRWMNIDVAHYQNVTLPPIKLFEIGGAYFVRDGNHRVSVARVQGAEFIDAEVTSLASEVPITPGMSRQDIVREVIAFERRRFLAETGLAATRPGADLAFTEIGRYDEILEHIREHKWYLNLHQTAEIPLAEAAASWYDRVYLPIVKVIREERLLARFPKATEADLYVYIAHHWAELGRRYGPIFTLEEAAVDYSSTSRKPWLLRQAARWGRGLRTWWQATRRSFRI